MRRPAASCCAISSSRRWRLAARPGAARPAGRREAEGEADEIAAEGWKWIEVAVELSLRPRPWACASFRHHGRSDRRGTRPARRCAAEYDRLEAEYEEADELPDEIDQRSARSRRRCRLRPTGPSIYDPAEIARAGVFVSIDADGSLSIDRGYVRAGG
jgi:ParB family chromosome partitioning protein